MPRRQFNRVRSNNCQIKARKRSTCPCLSKLPPESCSGSVRCKEAAEASKRHCECPVALLRVRSSARRLVASLQSRSRPDCRTHRPLRMAVVGHGPRSIRRATAPRLVNRGMGDRGGGVYLAALRAFRGTFLGASSPAHDSTLGRGSAARDGNAAIGTLLPSMASLGSCYGLFLVALVLAHARAL